MRGPLSPQENILEKGKNKKGCTENFIKLLITVGPRFNEPRFNGQKFLS